MDLEGDCSGIAIDNNYSIDSGITLVKWLRRPQQLIIYGVILVIVGSLLLAFGNGVGGGFVFVFPFFFAAGSATFPLILGMGIFVVMSILILVLWLRPFLMHLEERGTIILEEKPSSSRICSVCGERAISKANFCSICGNQMSSSDHNDEYY